MQSARVPPAVPRRPGGPARREAWLVRHNARRPVHRDLRERGERADLVTIPSRISEQAARAAMPQAAKVGNREHAPAILAAITLTADETSASLKPGVRE